MPRLSNSQPGLSRQRSILNAFRLKKQPAKSTKPLQISEPILISPEIMDVDRFCAAENEGFRTPLVHNDTFEPFESARATPLTPHHCDSPPGLDYGDSCPESPESIFHKNHSRDNSDVTAYWSSVRDDDEESVYSTLDDEFVSVDENRESLLESASIHTVERVYFGKPTVHAIGTSPVLVV